MRNCAMHIPVSASESDSTKRGACVAWHSRVIDGADVIMPLPIQGNPFNRPLLPPHRTPPASAPSLKVNTGALETWFNNKENRPNALPSLCPKDRGGFLSAASFVLSRSSLCLRTFV